MKIQLGKEGLKALQIKGLSFLARRIDKFNICIGPGGNRDSYYYLCFSRIDDNTVSMKFIFTDTPPRVIGNISSSLISIDLTAEEFRRMIDD